MKGYEAMGISLYKPDLSEMGFRRELLADEDTMSYNAHWGGAIDFPEEDWEGWYSHWLINTDARRFYRYIKDDEMGEFVGEAAYHIDTDSSRCLADVIVHSRFRNRGIGTAALGLLCKAAKENGVDVICDNIAKDNPGISLFIKNGFTEEYRDDEIIMLRKEL